MRFNGLTSLLVLFSVAELSLSAPVTQSRDLGLVSAKSTVQRAAEPFLDSDSKRQVSVVVSRAQPTNPIKKIGQIGTVIVNLIAQSPRAVRMTANTIENAMIGLWGEMTNNLGGSNALTANAVFNQFGESPFGAIFDTEFDVQFNIIQAGLTWNDVVNKAGGIDVFRQSVTQWMAVSALGFPNTQFEIIDEVTNTVMATIGTVTNPLAQ